MTIYFNIVPANVSSHLSQEVPRHERRSILIQATNAVFGRLSIYFLHEGTLYYCQKPGSMVALPFGELRSLKARMIDESYLLVVGRAPDYCVVILERIAGGLTCFAIKLASAGQLCGVLPSETGRLCIVASAQNLVRSSHTFQCTLDSCVLVTSHLPLPLANARLTLSLPTPDGCLEFYQHTSGQFTGQLTLFYQSPANYPPTTPATTGPLVHLTLSGNFIGLTQTPPPYPVNYEKGINFISWSPEKPSENIFVSFPDQVNSLTPLTNRGGAVLGIDVAVSGTVWMIDRSGCRLYEIQLQPRPVHQMPVANPDSQNSQVSANPDGSIIIWSLNGQIQAASTTLPPIPWRPIESALRVSKEFSLGVVDMHSCGQLQAVPDGT